MHGKLSGKPLAMKAVKKGRELEFKPMQVLEVYTSCSKFDRKPISILTLEVD